MTPGAASPGPRRSLPRPTDRIPLGESNVQVSPFCLGWVTDPDTVLAAFDAGINFFFLPSDYHLGLYRNSIEGLKRLLARGPDIRDRIVVAGVGYIENPRFFPATLRELLWIAPELGTLDVGVAGAVSLSTAGRIDQLREMRLEGQHGLKSVGGSFHSRPAALLAITQQAIDVAFVRYNVAHPGAREDLFPFLAPTRKTTIFNFVNSAGYVDDASWARLALPPGQWRPELSDHYRFVLTRPEVDGLLVAPKIPAHVDRILRAVEAGPLDPEEEDHMIDLSLLARGLATLGPDAEAPSTEAPAATLKP